MGLETGVLRNERPRDETDLLGPTHVKFDILSAVCTSGMHEHFKLLVMAILGDMSKLCERGDLGTRFHLNTVHAYL